MNARRASTLAALLCTAALLLAEPSLFGALGARGRTDARLMPPKARTLMVWLLSDDVADARLLSRLMTAFERETPGARVCLRRAHPSELAAASAEPPDVALYGVGDVVSPQDSFLPLAQWEEPDGPPMDGAGASGGERYAAALWHEPSALIFPAAWLGADAPPKRDDGYFQLETPKPSVPPVTGVEALPWGELLAPGALEKPSGIGLQQLLYSCPEAARPTLVAALSGEKSKAAPARVVTLREALSRANGLAVCALEPAASSRVRFASVARDGEDARALLRFLCSDAARDAALEDGLMPTEPPAEIAEPLRAAFALRCAGGTFAPNAFAHTREELEALCADAFARGEDPARTLLGLR